MISKQESRVSALSPPGSGKGPGKKLNKADTMKALKEAKEAEKSIIEDER